MHGYKKTKESKRKNIVSSFRRGKSMREVARQHGVSVGTVHYWVKRTENQRLDRADWNDRPVGCKQAANRTTHEIEDTIIMIRQELKNNSALGEFGAVAIHRELVNQNIDNPPSIRTIGRILERCGALDGRKRTRRASPPRGWYLPDVAKYESELDSFDIVEGLAMDGGRQVEILTGISIHGALPAAWPNMTITSKIVVQRLVDHWREVGLPHYAQFDNDTLFQGPHVHPDVVGRVTRLCLSLDITPVFVPPREPGFQASIESFNGRWQTKVWGRFYYNDMAELVDQSDQYIAAVRQHAADRIKDAPDRRPFPKGWKLNLQKHPVGQIIYLRRTTDNGSVSLLGHVFEINPIWPHRLVRCEVNLSEEKISFYALRRREPSSQPMLKETSYKLPKRRFKE